MSWLRARVGTPTEDDDPEELMVKNPTASSTMNALIMQHNSGLLDPNYLLSAMPGFGGWAVHPQQPAPSMLATDVRIPRRPISPETPAEPATGFSPASPWVMRSGARPNGSASPPRS